MVVIDDLLDLTKRLVLVLPLVSLLRYEQYGRLCLPAGE